MRNVVNKHILVFDSGLGGTTVLKEIQQRLPEYTFSYALDNEAFPYGNKTNTFLLARTVKLFKHLINKSQPDLIVIACNTASTLILDELRSQFDLPFIGVVPAIKPAAAHSKTGVICLLATEATVDREYVKQLNDDHANHCDVIKFGCQKLVELAENKMMGVPIDKSTLQAELKELLNHPLAAQIDTFVLGCTHFPAIKNELAEVWPHPVEWIDSGDAIARRAEELCLHLMETKHLHTPSLYLTKKDQGGLIQNTLISYGINKCQLITME